MVGIGVGGMRDKNFCRANLTEQLHEVGDNILRPVRLPVPESFRVRHGVGQRGVAAKRRGLAPVVPPDLHCPVVRIPQERELLASHAEDSRGGREGSGRQGGVGDRREGRRHFLEPFRRKAGRPGLREAVGAERPPIGLPSQGQASGSVERDDGDAPGHRARLGGSRRTGKSR